VRLHTPPRQVAHVRQGTGAHGEAASQPAARRGVLLQRGVPAEAVPLPVAAWLPCAQPQPRQPLVATAASRAIRGAGPTLAGPALGRGRPVLPRGPSVRLAGVRAAAGVPLAATAAALGLPVLQARRERVPCALRTGLFEQRPVQLRLQVTYLLGRARGRAAAGLRVG
jgi:hypothetical protein